MPLSPLVPTDTRAYFRPLTGALAGLLRTLPDEAWTRTAVGAWQVRDVVAHLIDVGMRRLSFHRDGHAPPPPPFAIAGEQDFTRFINQINAEWVGASKRVSTRRLAETYAGISTELSAFFEAQPLEGKALFGVSWAGEMTSENWFDIGREFTEQWHHQAQIRDAAGAPPPEDPAWLRATLEILVRGLPHAYRAHEAPSGTDVAIDVTGASGGRWTLVRDGGWGLLAGESASPAARVTLTDDTAWRLLTNGLAEGRARAAVHVSGDEAHAAPLLRARSIVV